jgi:hypothetical protein
MIWRGYLDHTYFTCQRTQHKTPISLMRWDNGLLVWKDYADRDVNGSFEFKISKEASLDRQELTPDVKLINPVDISMQIEHVSARAGEGYF